MSRINFEYLSPFKEPWWFGALWLRTKRAATSDATLIINVCLIGEFAASVPAMSALISSLPGPVDLLVSAPIKPLALRMRRIRHVYVARSSVGRANESVSSERLPDSYGTIYALRMSADAYRALSRVSAAKVKTGLRQFGRYGAHLGWRMLIGKTPRSWREVTFSMTGLPERYAPLEEMFDFTHEEYSKVAALPELGGAEKKIILHTGASWVKNRWPTERWATLLELLHKERAYRFIFVGSPKDEAEFNALKARLPFPLYSLIGKVDLRELLLAIHSCDYFIGVDSGPRNLAHLAGVRSITLLGPAPHMYTPPDSRDIVLDKSGGRGVSERFIHLKGTSLMEKHTPQEVLSAFKKLQG